MSIDPFGNLLRKMSEWAKTCHVVLYSIAKLGASTKGEVVLPVYNQSPKSLAAFEHHSVIYKRAIHVA